MFDFPHPLRLAVGSHQRGSGKGCAMNIISYESGDTTITDLPACADTLLAKIVQQVNDTICTHRDGDLLCPECSLTVLALAHRTVGTGGLFDLDRHRVWVRIAADQARQVLHLAHDRAATERAVLAAEKWAADPSAKNRADAASATASADDAYAAAAYAAAASAAYASAAASAYGAAAADAASAYGAAAADAASAYGAAADAYADAYAAAADAYADAYAAVARIALAHRAIDLFYELTRLTERAPDRQRTEAAYAAMTATA